MKKSFCLIWFLCSATNRVRARSFDLAVALFLQAKDYVQHRSSSYDRSGGNGDARPIAPAETLTLLDADGPGLISHVWVTIAQRRSASFEGAGAADVLGRGGHAQR